VQLDREDLQSGLQGTVCPLESTGQPSKVINVAIAHKLLRQAFAVATTNAPFSAEYA